LERRLGEMAKKLESSFINMFLSLTFVSAGMAAVLALVYISTKDSIAKAERQKTENAIKNVIPAFNKLVIKKIALEGSDSITLNYGYNSDSLVGIAVETYTSKGFGGKIKCVIGVLPNGNINNIGGFEMRETPGLGTKLKDPKFLTQFLGKNPAHYILKVKKDGGQVDAITAATVSSRAFCDAAQKAYSAIEKGGKK
jgi:Na+-translocating ferredoxin:NAD+ oxidoreductase subunit G